MFGRVDFWEDEKTKKKKKRRENKEGKLFRRCLVGRGRGRGENDSGARVFSPRAGQNIFSPQNGEKTWETKLVVAFFFFNSLRLKLLLFFFNNILLDWAFAFCFGLTRHDFIF